MVSVHLATPSHPAPFSRQSWEEHLSAVNTMKCSPCLGEGSNHCLHRSSGKASTGLPCTSAQALPAPSLPNTEAAIGNGMMPHPYNPTPLGQGPVRPGSAGLGAAALTQQEATQVLSGAS